MDMDTKPYTYTCACGRPATVGTHSPLSCVTKAPATASPATAAPAQPPPPKRAIRLADGRILAVTPMIFNSWTGRRYLDGVEWHKPVLQSDGTAYTGARACTCARCQEFVSPTITAVLRAFPAPDADGSGGGAL